MQAVVCCRGDMNNVPSIRGYLHNKWNVNIFNVVDQSCDPPLKDDHLTVAENTGNLVHLVSCITWENEAASLVIPDAAFIFHLQNIIWLDSNIHSDLCV